MIHTTDVLHYILLLEGIQWFALSPEQDPPSGIISMAAITNSFKNLKLQFDSCFESFLVLSINLSSIICSQKMDTFDHVVTSSSACKISLNNEIISSRPCRYPSSRELCFVVCAKSIIFKFGPFISKFISDPS